MPPATKTGTLRRCGRISCANTAVETGPIWPPASMPSMTMASAPMRTSFLAMASAGAKQSSFAPDSLMRLTAAAGGKPPASTTWPTRALAQTSTSARSCGWSVMRLTPKGRVVSAAVAAISAASCGGFIEPQAMTPKPPPFEMAETRWRSDTHVMAPPMMARSTPRNAVPRRHKSSSRRRAPAPAGSDPEAMRRSASGIIASAGVEAVGGVERAKSEFGVFLGDEDAHLYLGRGDHLDVDVLFGERLEHLLRHAGMAAHADADHGNLHHIGIWLQRLEPERRALLLQHLDGAVEVGLADGKGEIGEASILGDVLHDHVDVDRMLGEWAENGRGDAGPIRHPNQRDLRLVAAIGDTAHHLLFHDLVLVDHQRSGSVLEARQHLHAHAMVHRHLDRARLQHLGALRSELEHLLVGNSIELLRLRNDPGIAGIDAVNVGEDVATVRLERGRQRHRRGVRAAAAQRGDAIVGAEPLKTRHHSHLPFAHAADELGAGDLGDARLAVHGIGAEGDLPAEPGAGVDAEILQCQRQQPGRHLFA